MCLLVRIWKIVCPRLRSKVSFLTFSPLGRRERTEVISGSESPEVESNSCFCSFSFALTRGKRWYIITKAERNHIRNRIQSSVPSILCKEYINLVMIFICYSTSFPAAYPAFFSMIFSMRCFSIKRIWLMKISCISGTCPSPSIRTFTV